MTYPPVPVNIPDEEGHKWAVLPRGSSPRERVRFVCLWDDCKFNTTMESTLWDDMINTLKFINRQAACNHNKGYPYLRQFKEMLQYHL